MPYLASDNPMSTQETDAKFQKWLEEQTAAGAVVRSDDISKFYHDEAVESGHGVRDAYDPNIVYVKEPASAESRPRLAVVVRDANGKILDTLEAATQEEMNAKLVEFGKQHPVTGQPAQTRQLSPEDQAAAAANVDI